MRIVCTILLAAVIAVTLGCGYSKKMQSPVAGVMPTVSQLSPNSATHGGAGFTLTINGTNFATNAVVNWNNAAQATSFVSSKQLTVVISASMIATSGSAQLSVTNPATPGGGIYGGGGTMAETSTPMTFTIQ